MCIRDSNKTFNGVPEHVYIGDSERNALSLQYAKAYLRYIKPEMCIRDSSVPTSCQDLMCISLMADVPN